MSPCKTFFLQCQKRHLELPKIPTYLPPCQCHPRLVSYSRGGVVHYLFMLCSCAPLSFFLPSCACYGVFYRASSGPLRRAVMCGV